jgi:hypothetical protein
VLRRECPEGEDVFSGLLHQGRSNGAGFGEHRDHLIPLLLQRCLVLLDEHRVKGGSHHVLAVFRHLGQEIAGKALRERCQLQTWQQRAMAFLSPAWASLITSCTPESPRSRRRRRKTDQKVSSSLSPTSIPSTSRRPVAVIPTATITALESTCLRA